MQKGLLALYLLCTCLILNAQSSQNVVFGEWPRYFQPEEQVIRVFMDKNGDYYPNTIIPQEELLANDAAIADYFQAEEEAFLATAATYGLTFDAYSEEAFATLQSAIIGRLSDLINQVDAQSDLFLLIHGFRKPMLPQRGGYPSIREYAGVRNSIQQQYSGVGRTAFFVELYWDGTYDCCIGRKTKVNKRIFKLFEDVAQQQASEVGYGLRKLVAEIEREELSIVTHSLGAQVGLSLLANAFDERVTTEEQAIPTPHQSRVNVCMVAPAISREPFADYHERTIADDFRTVDNYHLNIVYNEKDFVLKKRWKIFGPGPKKYGNTSLGCNCRNEAEKLSEDFATSFPNSDLRLFEAGIGGTHRFTRYARSNAFLGFLETVLE